jgi:maleylacetoacetate isomerase
VYAAHQVVEAVPESEKEAKKNEWARFWIERGFTALEQVLATTAGTYCVGDSITMADVYLRPQVYSAHLYSVDMMQFPTIVRIAAALAALPEFETTHPSQQPDASQ